MGFRKEVRSFMRKMEIALVRKETVVQAQSRMILVLQGQNKDLLNRLMARDYPELETYSPVGYKKEDEPTMDFEHNEDLAGTIVDPDEVEDAE